MSYGSVLVQSQPSLRDQLTQLNYANQASSANDDPSNIFSQAWFIVLISLTGLLLFTLILLMSYCVYRKQSPKQRRGTIINAVGLTTTYGSTVESHNIDVNNNLSRIESLGIGDRGAAASGRLLLKQSTLIAYPDVHIEVTVPLQVQPTAEQLVQDTALDGDASLQLQLQFVSNVSKQASDASAASATGSKRKSSSQAEDAIFDAEPLPVDHYLAAPHGGDISYSTSNVSCSSTPSVLHRTCSPTQSLPASTTGSSSSGVAHSSVSTARRSRLKGLLESRRGSTASLTISLTPSSSTALGSIGTDDSIGPLGSFDSRSSSSLLPASVTGSGERTILEHMVAAKGRPPLILSALNARMQQNVPAIHEEFWSIPMNHFHKVTVPGASIKNRYRTILPNEHSRVTLHPPFHHRSASISSPPATSQNGLKLSTSGDIHNNNNNNVDAPVVVDPLSVYINANYVRAYVPSVDRANPVAQALASRAFIATQGPLPNTINDFWRMCWFERTPCIVMITRLVEKSKVKCEAYLPPFNGAPSVNASAVSPSTASSPSGPLPLQLQPQPQPGTPSNAISASPPASIVTQSFGDVQVSVLSLQIKDGYEVRDVLLQFNNETHAVKHYWFTAWPDNKTPSTAKQLIHVILEIRAHRDKQAAILQRIRQRHNSPSCSLRASTSESHQTSNAAVGCVSQASCASATGNGTGTACTLQTACGEQPIVLGPTVVHCSAGLGRTGCFIAICNAIQQFEAEQAVDVLGIVAQMRLDRGGLIQTNEQYEFVYRAICEYATNYSCKTSTSMMP